MNNKHKTKDERYYAMFDKALNFHAPKFDKDKELVAYYELDQEGLELMKTKPWVYSINTPFATDAVNIRVASLQANDYTGEVEPLSPDDIKMVESVNRAQKEMWKEMNMDSMIDDAILQAAVVGESYAHILYESDAKVGGTNRKRNGKMKAYFVDTSSVHIDPEALSLSTANYICISERITKGELERDYSYFNLKDLASSETPDSRGEIFLGEDQREPVDPVYTKVTIYEKTKGGLEKTILVDKKILVKTEKMKISRFPIAQLVWQKKLKSPYGTSLMAMLLPLQKVYNAIESANANANLQYSNPSFVISEESGIDPAEFAASAGAPGVVYEIASGTNINDAVAPLISQRGIDQGLVITKQELEKNMYKIAGITEQFQGALGTAGNTSSGSDRAIQRAKTVEERILTNIEEFVEDLTHIIIEYIVHGFAGETIYTRGEKKVDGKYDFEAVELPTNMEALEYTFNIELNVRTNYSKEQQKLALMEIWQQERQYGNGNEVMAVNTLDLLKVLEIPQREEIVDRYEQAVSMDSEQKAQLISEIYEIARDLGLDPELANAAVAEVIRGDLDTPALDQFMQMAQDTALQQEQDFENAERDMIQGQEAQRVAQEEAMALEEQQIMELNRGDMEFTPDTGGEEEMDMGDMEFMPN